MARVSLDETVSAVVLVLVGALVILPLLFLLYGAFSTGSPGQKGNQLTLEHLRTVYLSGKYLGTLLDTVQLAALVTVFSTAVGTVFAWLVARTDMPGRRLFELLIIVPLFVSPLLGALAWVALAAPGSGFINAVLRTFAGRTADLVDIYSFGGIVFVMFLYYVPYAYLFVVGALKNMDPALEEAARTVSAGVVATMWRVTLPLMLPALLSSALLVFVLAAELFSVPAMLGARVQIHTIPTVIYFGFQYGTVPVGEVSALATMLLWVTAAGIFLYRRTVAFSRRYVTVSGKGYRARPIELGPWRWAGWGLVMLYVLVAVVLPYLALLLGSFLKFLTPKLRPGSFTLDNYARITEPGTLVAIQNTLLLAVVTATATVLLAFVVSYLIVRGRGRVAVTMDYLSSLPVAIPGMALAVGLLWAYTILPVPIYGTIAMLLVAYMTRFIAYGVRIASSGLHQIDPELEEAGRLSGLSPLRAFRRIVLPLLRPSLISAWTLLFIFVVVEITATILLYTANTKTMAVVMWNAVEMAGSVGAFTLGVIQVTLVFGVLAGVYRVAGSLETGVG